jgi:glycosyltransferase involved in cell wall biosynthesis
MQRSTIIPGNTVVIILSFEGPDPYSLAGGLGARVTNFSHILSENGFMTHLFFIGDPRYQGEEIVSDGKLDLHRWCQWISQYYRNGVYQGENDKVNDYNQSIPPFVIDHIVKPSLAEDKLVVVLSEEWHTAEAVCRLSEQLRNQGLRDKVIMFWNANNTFGFNSIDWGRLNHNTTITTISRYMKRIMQGIGINPLIIPNGVSETYLRKVNDGVSTEIKGRLKADILLTKVARYDPAKGWNQAVEATARLKRNGQKVVLLARGGIEPYGEEVLYNARNLGLEIKDIFSDGAKAGLKAINDSEADILNIKFHCFPELLHILYHASDAVLANSCFEPFGLVGLETMASGGVAFTGGTGEDYAIHMRNGVVLENNEPREIEGYVTYLENHPDQAAKIRRFARQTAERFTWQESLENLKGKIENQAASQGLVFRQEKPPVLGIKAPELIGNDSGTELTVG